jgi:two-component system sensor histidine kinase VicK
MIVHGAKIGAIIVLRDVTREKMVESMKSEFVTVAAHQLRTPTSGIKWSLGMLKEGDLGPLSKEQKEVIGKAYNSNEKVIHLIADLLNVARIEGGKYLNKITLSSVEDLIQSLVAEYEDEMKRRELNFGFKKPKEKLPNIMMDVDKMGIAVGNLIDNAMRYTIAGGKISIYIAKKDEDQIEVQVHDTGLGIPQNQKDKVFTKFFRGDNITKVETEGTGLGLFITKNIIDAHGGKIWFESEKDKGTTFYFTIPIKEKFAEFITPELY